MLNERKGLLAMLFLGLACGLWAGYRLAPRAQIERQEAIAVKEDNRKVETVTVTRVIREPSGKVEIVRETKKTDQAKAQSVVKVESSKTATYPLASYRVDTGWNMRGQIQSLGLGVRVGSSPVWLGAAIHRSQHEPSRVEPLLTVGVEF